MEGDFPCPFDRLQQHTQRLIKIDDLPIIVDSSPKNHGNVMLNKVYCSFVPWNPVNGCSVEDLLDHNVALL